MEWTTLQHRKSGTEVVEQNRVQLDIPEKREDRELTLWAGQIKQALGGIKGELTVMLHTERVLMRVVDLPSSDPDELAEMVELQVDKFSPFPVEQMTIAYERLGEAGSSSRVLVAACKRDDVEELGALFTAVGRLPDRIDVAAAGWWHLIHQSDAVPAEGRHALLLMDDTGAELVVVQDGMPVIVRSLGAQHTASDEEYFLEIAEETGYTLTSLESEWGTTATPVLTVWHHGDPSPMLLEKIRAECAIEVLTQSLDQLPSLTEGGARRSIDDSAHTLDLAPAEWKAAASARATQRRAVAVVASLFLLWAAALSALFIVSHLNQRHVESLREEIAALEGPAEEARQLRHRIASLEQNADRTHSALEVLREVTQLMPSGLELTSFSYRKGGQVALRGESTRVPPIYDFFESLEESHLFVEVTPEGVTQAPGGRRKPDFRISARLPGDEP